MQRLNLMTSYVNSVVSAIPNESRNNGYMLHLHGVSSLCAMLALKRGLNPEIAAISGLLHDIYTLYSGVTSHHAHSSAEMVRPVLRDSDVFSAHEQQMICSAIFHHSDKGHLHDAYDEVLKDADVLHAYVSDPESKLSISRASRLDNIAKEWGLAIQPGVYDEAKRSGGTDNHDLRNRLATIAEELAGREIVGIPEDPDYQKIIRYWPDNNIADVLKNGWCAAFVYYCCMHIGFSLPIRVPNSSCRLAGVKAWHEWATSADLFLQDHREFLPERGDIVIYRHLIPPEKKRDNPAPTDHIGIVVSSDNAGFAVAEGNINNDNVSGIVQRHHHQDIEGFIRISDCYEYDGWKYDYKSGKIRIERL